MNKIDKLLKLSCASDKHLEIFEYLFIDVINKYEIDFEYDDSYYSVFISDVTCKEVFNKEMGDFQFDMLEVVNELQKQNNITFAYTFTKFWISVVFDLSNIHKLLEDN